MTQLGVHFYTFNYNVPAEYTVSNSSRLFIPLKVTKAGGRYYVEISGEVLTDTLSLIESWTMITQDAIELAKIYLDETVTTEII